MPSIVPSEVFLVNEDSHQFGYRKCRVRIVHLDGHFLSKKAPIRVATFESTHRIGQRTGNKKILLQQAQTLAQELRIVGIKNARQCLSRKGLGKRLYEIAMRKLFKIEVVRCSRSPEAESVDGGSAVPDDRSVKWNAD